MSFPLNHLFSIWSFWRSFFIYCSWSSPSSIFKFGIKNNNITLIRLNLYMLTFKLPPTMPRDDHTKLNVGWGGGGEELSCGYLTTELPTKNETLETAHALHLDRLSHATVPCNVFWMTSHGNCSIQGLNFTNVKEIL